MFRLSSALAWRMTATATVLGLALVWLLSGILTADEPEIQPTISELNQTTEESDAARRPLTVRARRSAAVERVRVLALNGRTEVKQVVTVQAEINGQVIVREVDDGATVKIGDALCSIAVNDRDANVLAGTDAVKFATLEYEGALSLRENEYQRES